MSDPLQERVKTLARAAWAEQGYVTATGARDADLLARALLPHIAAAVCNDLRDRDEVAITRTRLTEIAFPNVPSSGWAKMGDPAEAEAVYLNIRGDVWKTAGPHRTDRVQRVLNGQGLTLCRTKIRHDGEVVPAVYVTADEACIETDVFIPLKRRVEASQDTFNSDAVMLVERYPERAEKLLSDIKDTLTMLETRTQAALETHVNAAKRRIGKSLVESGDDS